MVIVELTGDVLSRFGLYEKGERARVVGEFDEDFPVKVRFKNDQCLILAPFQFKVVEVN